MSSDSWRCLIILPMTSRISASVRVRRSAALVSRLRISALIRRSVDTRRLSDAFMASLSALLISSCNTAMASRNWPARVGASAGAEDLGLADADTTATSIARTVGGAEADGAFGAGRRYRARGNGLRRHRPCRRRSLLQHRDG